MREVLDARFLAEHFFADQIETKQKVRRLTASIANVAVPDFSLNRSEHGGSLIAILN